MSGATYEVENILGQSAIVSGVGKVVIGTSIAGAAFNNLVFYADAEESVVIAAFPHGHWAGFKRVDPTQ